MADDEDSGESFMRKHMSEAQLSPDKSGYRDKGNAMLRDRMRGYRGDQYYEESYGKGMDFSDGTQSVNTGAKGNKR